MILSSFNLINITKHALDFFLKSFLFTKYSLYSSYVSIDAFILEVVLKERFNLAEGLSLKVGRSL